jgi:hypothetical protein
MNSFIVFEGIVQRSALNNLINLGPQPAGATYHPDQDLRAMNILSWTRINFGDWDGLRVGNKFYPANQALCKDLCRSDREKTINIPVYESRTGLFTSMRPGMDSILLNVNATTSVFFPSIKLQDWIYQRWCPVEAKSLASKNLYTYAPSARELYELEGLKVSWRGSTRTIFAAHSITVGVHTYLNKSKSLKF